jgi:hypothetical protein
MQGVIAIDGKTLRRRADARFDTAVISLDLPSTAS